VRVLLVSAYFAPHVGGVERFAELLAEGAAAAGDDVTVVTCRTSADSAEQETRAGYRVLRVPAINPTERRLGVPYPLPDPRSLLRVLRREVASADVVHVQDVLYPTSVAALLAAKRLRTPSLLTVHVGFVPQTSRLLDGAERLALRAAGGAARSATRAVAYNPDVARWAERSWALPSVDVLPVGVSLPAGEPDRAAFGLAPDRFVALFVGRDVRKKNLDVFLGAEDAAYDLLAVTDRQVPGRALPFMTPTRYASLLASVDAFVLPSVAEGLPLALQEAMAAGLPVVTTYQPGYEHYFAREDVLVVDPDPDAVRGALRRLASDTALRAALSARSRAVAARRFSAEAFVAAYRAAYLDLHSS
jgi:glycosyltransferase involved in cell wall biosynthesis